MWVCVVLGLLWLGFGGCRGDEVPVEAVLEWESWNGTNHVAYGMGWYFVLALPAILPRNEVVSGTVGWNATYIESHAAACTRVGLVSTDATVGLGRGRHGWDEGSIRSLVEALGAEVEGDVVQSCCSATLWCEGSPLKCHTSAIGGGEYDNVGFGANRAMRPVYTCVEPSKAHSWGRGKAADEKRVKSGVGAGESGDVVIPPFVFALKRIPPLIESVGVGRSGEGRIQKRDAFVFSENEGKEGVGRVGKVGVVEDRKVEGGVSVVRVEGWGLGRWDAGMDVRVNGNGVGGGGSSCQDVCSPCNQDTDCAGGKTCIFVVGATTGYCVETCTSWCLCGTKCIPMVGVSSGVSFGVCINDDATRNELVCNKGSAPFTPPSDQGDSAFEFVAPNGFGEADGFVAIGLENDRVDASSLLLTGKNLPQSGLAASTHFPTTPIPPLSLQLPPLLLSLNTSASRCIPPPPASPFSPTLLPSNWRLCPAQSDGSGAIFASIPVTTHPSSSTSSSQPPTAILFGFKGDGCETDEDCRNAFGHDICTITSCVNSTSSHTTHCVATTSSRCHSQPFAFHSSLPPPHSRTLFPLSSTSSALAPLPYPFPGSSASIADSIAPASLRDDKPMSPFPLTPTAIPNTSHSNTTSSTSPWKFAFPDREVDTVWVSPNGFVKLDSVQICQDPSLSDGTFTCGTNTAPIYTNSPYRNLLAPIVADWDPSQTPASTVIVRNGLVVVDDVGSGGRKGAAGEGAICVWWRDMVLYTSSPVLQPKRWTFGVCAFRDGAVRTVWESFPSDISTAHGIALAPYLFIGARTNHSYASMVGKLTTPHTGPLRPIPSSSSTADDAEGIDDDFEARTNPRGPDDPWESSGPADWSVASSAVREKSQSTLCSMGTVACASPRCGPVGTVVSIRWDGVGCGFGFGFGGEGMKVRCRFGAVEVEGAWVVEDGDKYLRCTAPPQSFASLPPLHNNATPTHNSPLPSNSTIATIPLSLILLTPASKQSAEALLASDMEQVFGDQEVGGRGWKVPDPWWIGNCSSNTTTPSSLCISGVGDPPHELEEDWAVTHLLVPGVLEIGEEKGVGGLGIEVATHELMFTYTKSPSPGQPAPVCGCDLSTTSTCDSCLVCRSTLSPNTSLSKDCNGDCLGWARTDDCGVCAGGRSGKEPDGDQDCNGVCFGPATECRSDDDDPSDRDDDDWLHDDWDNNDDGPGSGENNASFAFLLAIIASASICLLVCFWTARIVAADRNNEWPSDGDIYEARAPSLDDSTIQRLPVVPFHEADTKSVATRNTECPISMEPFEEGDLVIRLPCEHQFTPHLLHHYLSTSTRCPLCRFDLQAWANGSDPRASPAILPRPAPVHPSELELAPLHDSSTSSSRGSRGGGSAGVHVGGDRASHRSPPPRAVVPTTLPLSDRDAHFIDNPAGRRE